MQWSTLIFGSYNIEQIRSAVSDPEWQDFRLGLVGTSLPHKFSKLTEWVSNHAYSHESKVQVTNYVNALKRAGLVK